jgi:hypothetical protein
MFKSNQNFLGMTRVCQGITFYPGMSVSGGLPSWGFKGLEEYQV